MAFRQLIIAEGAASSSQKSVFQVTPGTRAIIKNLYLYNSGSTAETVKFFLKRATGSIRQVYQVVLDAGESAQLIEDELWLDGGDAMYLQTTSAADYVISGSIT